MIPNLSVINKILSIGSSAFVQQAAGSVMFVAANHMLVSYGGDLAVAVFGIIHRILMFALMPIIGIMQGLLPIVGYNYGANLHNRVSESIWLAIKTSTMVILVGFVAIMLFPRAILSIFTPDLAAIEMGETALRVMFALSITIGVQVVTGGVFQALGKARAAFILTMSRQVLFLIPLILVLPLWFSLEGIWVAFPIADLLSFGLTLWFIKEHQSVFFPADNLRVAEPNTN
nr:MATE family efflux transporter [Desulforamulus aquiferis]